MLGQGGRGGRSRNAHCLPHPLPLRHQFGQPEVQNLGLAAVCDEQVGWLDVPVNDPARVCGVEPVGNLKPQVQDSLGLQGPATDAVLHRLALQILHGDEGLAVVLVNGVNRADVRMVQGRGGAGFALESL